MSGVTRRRQVGGEGADGAGTPARSTTPNNKNGNTTSGGGRAGGNQASPIGGERESDHKIAYDPKDMEQGEERKKQPKLTLMEEILLLGLKDREGYLSFWNDNISYTLRGCIVMELALRGKIQMQSDSSRRRFPLADRTIDVIDDKPTGEVLLDEALKMMKASEKMSVGTWIDLMSGETWNLMKIGYQLKQVRERLAKGLVDKGLLRTEKKNFLLFDMATHPVVDNSAKDEIRVRTINTLAAKTLVLKDTQWFPESAPVRYIRTIAMVCAAYAANVLENALEKMGNDARERAFNRVDELLAGFSTFPFAVPPSGSSGVGQNLASAINEEIEANRKKELQFEVIAAVLQVYTRLDSIL